MGAGICRTQRTKVVESIQPTDIQSQPTKPLSQRSGPESAPDIGIEPDSRRTVKRNETSSSEKVVEEDESTGKAHEMKMPKFEK